MGGAVKRCTLVIPDSGPINSLWVAEALPLLLQLEMRIVLLDAIYDELTSDPLGYAKDREVKAFIEQHQPPFVLVATEKGRNERERVRHGLPRSKNAGDIAITEFMTAEDGLAQWLAPGEPVLILFEDTDIPRVRFFRKPSHLHLLSTVGMLRGMERAKIITSADAVIHAMIHPADATRAGRRFTDLPDGVDDAAAIGSVWTPQ